MLVLFIKTVYVVAAILFLGFGMGSVYYKLRAYSTRDAAVIAFADREIVRADWLFTVPSGFVLPLTGATMVHFYGLPWMTPWILTGLLAWAVAGLTWLPAAFLQLRMRALAASAHREGASLSIAYHRAHRAWMLLGVPSFLAAMTALFAMIAKTVAF